MVKIEYFLRHTPAGLFYAGNRGKELPEIFIGLLIEHPAATADKALLHAARTVVGTAQELHPLVNCDIFSWKTAVAHQVCGSCQRSQTPAYQINLPFSIVPAFDLFVRYASRFSLRLFSPSVNNRCRCGPCRAHCKNLTKFFHSRFPFFPDICFGTNRCAIRPRF